MNLMRLLLLLVVVTCLVGSASSRKLSRKYRLHNGPVSQLRGHSPKRMLSSFEEIGTLKISDGKAPALAPGGAEAHFAKQYHEFVENLLLNYVQGVEAIRMNFGKTLDVSKPVIPLHWVVLQKSFPDKAFEAFDTEGLRGLFRFSEFVTKGFNDDHVEFLAGMCAGVRKKSRSPGTNLVRSMIRVSNIFADTLLYPLKQHPGGLTSENLVFYHTKALKQLRDSSPLNTDELIRYFVNFAGPQSGVTAFMEHAPGWSKLAQRRDLILELGIKVGAGNEYLPWTRESGQIQAAWRNMLHEIQRAG